MRRLIYRFRNPHNIESALRTPPISTLLLALPYTNCRRSVYRRQSGKETQIILENPPAGKSEVTSLELVEFNSPVTLSQLYALLDKVAKKIGNVYLKNGLKNGDATLVQLAQNYYKLANVSRTGKLLIG